MEPVVGAADQELVALRRSRAELGGSMAALKRAVVPPVQGQRAGWTDRVDGALAELSAAFAEHVAVTEGPDGLHDAVLASAPRLSNAVGRLVSEHGAIRGLIADLLARVRSPVAADDAEAIRELAAALLGRLARHRRHGADLVHQAYQVDLGGET